MTYVFPRRGRSLASGQRAELTVIDLEGATRVILTADEVIEAPNWSADGQWLVFNGRTVAFLSYPPGTTGHPPDKDVLLRLMTPAGENQRTLASFFGGQGTINVNSWAPDSRRLAYVAYPIGSGA